MNNKHYAINKNLLIIGLVITIIFALLGGLVSGLENESAFLIKQVIKILSTTGIILIAIAEAQKNNILNAFFLLIFGTAGYGLIAIIIGLFSLWRTIVINKNGFDNNLENFWSKRYLLIAAMGLVIIEIVKVLTKQNNFLAKLNIEGNFLVIILSLILVGLLVLFFIKYYKIKNLTPKTINLEKGITTGYKIARILLLIGLIFFIGYLFLYLYYSIFEAQSIQEFFTSASITILLFTIAMRIIFWGIAVVAFQKARENKIQSAILIWFFGIFTLGIWPFYSAKKSSKEINEKI